jgi:hypothetical protein
MDNASGGIMTWREKSLQYESLLTKNPLGWRLVITERKLCGVAPKGVQVGDLVGIIRGGNMPFVLRKS